MLKNKEILENDTNTTINKKNGTFTILGFSIWKLFAYFIIYSIAGYIIETLFGIFTKGVWESRQSFLYGPFCAIYGLGAVIMIVFLQYFTKNYNTLFIGGFIIGSITEYLVSLIGELILGVKWWDYSNMPLNLDGRICVFYSIFWGFLGIYLMCSLNPKVDRLIEWIKSKISMPKLKTITSSLIIFLLIDCIVTGYALSLFIIRMIEKNNLDVQNKEIISSQYSKIYEENPKRAEFIYKFWGDKKMLKTFPNLKITDKNGNIIYMDSLLPDIQPYYLLVHEKKK